MSNENSDQFGDQVSDHVNSDDAIVTRKQDGFTVQASPFNAVKFDLGVILCVALLLWLVVGRLDDRYLVQLGVLALYGLGAMTWLMIRVNRIMKQIMREQGKDIAGE